MKSQKNIIKKIALTIIAICFWLFVWHFLSIKIHSSIFLPSPMEVMKALKNLSRQDDFWKIIINTFGKIAKGFGLAVVCGVILAVISHFIKIIDVLVSPLMKLIKAVPVASFIILALLWIKSSQLSVLISFIMVMPVIYINVKQGFLGVNTEMLEMAKVFRVSFGRKLRFIYLPYVLPAFISACKVGLGFCFKSGIAAEIIGLPAKSIGGELYKSKLYLMTDELFAWTVIIVLMSVFFEGICIYLLGKLGNSFGRVNIIKELGNDEIEEKVNMEKSDLVISKVSKSFGKKQVLKNVNLSVEKGKILCLTGVSGEGKTTLLRIIAGTVKADAGNVSLTDAKITDKPKISMVFQEDRLIEESDIYTNLYCTLGKEFNKKSVDMHLEEVGLGGMGRANVKTLSGGMKRRVAIVRAILVKSNILLLDEAFKGLDSELKNNIIGYVKKHQNGKVILMVTHDENECEIIGGRIIDLAQVNGVKNE